jgi:hypothetical protein
MPQRNGPYPLSSRPSASRRESRDPETLGGLVITPRPRCRGSASILGAHGTPKEITTMINAAAVEAFSDPAVRQRLADLCQEILRASNKGARRLPQDPSSTSDGRSPGRRGSRRSAAGQRTRPARLGPSLKKGERIAVRISRGKTVPGRNFFVSRHVPAFRVIAVGSSRGSRAQLKISRYCSRQTDPCFAEVALEVLS